MFSTTLFYQTSAPWLQIVGRHTTHTTKGPGVDSAIAGPLSTTTSKRGTANLLLTEIWRGYNSCEQATVQLEHIQLQWASLATPRPCWRRSQSWPRRKVAVLRKGGPREAMGDCIVELIETISVSAWHHAHLHLNDLLTTMIGKNMAVPSNGR